MIVINDPRTREEIQASIDAYASALEAHSKTVGVPAPLTDYVTEQIVKSGQEWVLSSEIPTETPEEATPTIEDVKSRRLQFMQEARDAQMASGLEFGGHIYHADKDSIRDVLMALTGAQMATKQVPETIAWKLKVREGATTHVPLNLSQIVELFEALTANMLAIYAKEEARMATILQASTVEEVLAVVW